MKRCKKSQKISFTIDDYIRANKAINRLEELERNGGHWTAVNRPHKNKKKYDRKRDRKIDSDGLFNFLFIEIIKYQILFPSFLIKFNVWVFI